MRLNRVVSSLRIRPGFALNIWVSIGALLISAQTSHAARFANQFIEFELPPQWQCTLEGAEWVCQNSNEVKKRDAIIVLAAKLKGDQDSLDQYLNYLKQPKIYSGLGGKPIRSQAKYADVKNFNGQPWVDALHLESEIPGFYTRYLATIKQDIGVLVTYSINKNKYQAYLGDFDNMVKTLKVFRKPGGINQNPQSGGSGNALTPPPVSNNSIFGDINPQGTSPQPTAKKKKPQDDDTLFYLVLGGAVVGFLIWKRRRGG